MHVEGASVTQDELMTERQSVYGHWRLNMEGTSKQLDRLLAQWQNCNGEETLPP